MPVIKAIVPPDTPGTTSAAPMPIPFREVSKYLLILLITCLNEMLEFTILKLIGQIIEEGISAHATSKCFQCHYFVWSNIAEADIGSYQFNKHYLLRLIGRFPYNIIYGDMFHDGVYKIFVCRTICVVDPNSSRFPCLGDHFPGTGIQFGLHILYPYIIGNNQSLYFCTDLGEYGSVAGKISYDIQFFFMFHFYGTIGYLHGIHLKLIKESFVVVQFISYRKHFEKCSSKIDPHAGTPVDVDFFFQLRSYQGCSETKFYQVSIISGGIGKMLGLF